MPVDSVEMVRKSMGGLVSFTIALTGGVFGRRVGWHHRDDLVGARLLITVWDLHQHAIFSDFEDNFAADGQDHRMFQVHRTDAIVHLVRAQQVLWAKFLVGGYVGDPDGSPVRT